MVHLNPESPNISESNRKKLKTTNKKVIKKKAVKQHGQGKHLQSVLANGTKEEDGRLKKSHASKQDKGEPSVNNKDKRKRTGDYTAKEKEVINKKDSRGNYVNNKTDDNKGGPTNKIKKRNENHRGTNLARSPPKVPSFVTPRKKTLETQEIKQEKDRKKEKERTITARETANHDHPTSNKQHLGRKNKKSKTTDKVTSTNPKNMNTSVGMKHKTQKKSVVQVKPLYSTKRKQLQDSTEGRRDEEKPVNVISKGQQNNVEAKVQRRYNIVSKKDKDTMHHHHHHEQHQQQQQHRQHKNKQQAQDKQRELRHKLRSSKGREGENGKKIARLFFKKIFHKNIFRHFRGTARHNERSEKTQVLDSTDCEHSEFTSNGMSRDGNASLLKETENQNNLLRQRSVDIYSNDRMETPLIKSKILVPKVVQNRNSSTVTTNITGTSTSISRSNSNCNSRMKATHVVKSLNGIKSSVAQSQPEGITIKEIDVRTLYQQHKKNFLIPDNYNQKNHNKNYNNNIETTKTAGQVNDGESDHDGRNVSYYPLFISEATISAEMTKEFSFPSTNGYHQNTTTATVHKTR